MKRKATDLDLISIRTAVAELPISRPRLTQAIEQKEIPVFYTGIRAVKVRREDVEKLLTTPPRKPQDTAPAPQAA